MRRGQTGVSALPYDILARHANYEKEKKSAG